MPLDSSHVGREYGPYHYALGAEKMREFAFAIAGGLPSSTFGSPPAGLNPLFYEEEAAQRGPYGALIAFPTFAVNFAMKPFTEALADPELEVELIRVVHGEQEFEFHEVMRAGDVMTTRGRISRILEKGSLTFVVMETQSHNQHGRLVVTETWTAIIRR
jgi:acyl dehydratase